MIALLTFVSGFAGAEEGFTPFKLEAKYFEDASVKDKAEFEHDGKSYRIKNSKYERGLYLKNDGSWVKHGVFYKYLSGKLHQKLVYFHGKLHGEQLSYFTENGKVRRRREFENGLQHGQWEDRFEKSGTVWHEGTYEKGKKQGAEKVYFSNGQVQFDKTYKDGKMHGTRLQYTDKGKPFGRSHWKMGKQIGKTEWLYKK